MSRFNDWFNNHTIHASINNLVNSIKIVEEEEIDSSDTLVEFQRIKDSLYFIKESIEAIVPEILPVNHSTNQLNQMNSSISAAINQINNFGANKNAAELVNANKQIDGALQIIPQLNFIRAKSAARGVAAATRNFSETVERFMKHIENEKSKLVDDLSNVQKEVKNIEGNLNTFDETIKTYDEKISTTYKTYEDRLTESQNKVLTELEQIKQQQNTSINQFLQESKKEFQNKLEEFSDNYKKQEQDIVTASNEIIEEMENQKETASTLLELTTNMAVAGDFKKNADLQSKKANFLRILAIFFMLIAIGGAAYIIFISETVGKNRTQTILRLATSGLFTIPAAYAARESSRHRRLESQYRQVQLDLAALDPFIEMLPEEKKEDLKTEITQRIFGRGVEDNHRYKEENEVSAPTFLSLLERVGKFFTK